MLAQQILSQNYIFVFSNTESVRDVQFCPQQPHTFAAVSENGHVQQWDMRKPDRYFQHFTAHSGPIFACDWHPEATWLATASRDKTIKVHTLLSSRFLSNIITIAYLHSLNFIGLGPIG